MTKTKETKTVFEVTKKLEDGTEQELKLAIVSPSWEAQLEAQDKYNISFRRSWKSGAPLRPKLDEFLREEEIWTTQKEADLTSLQKEYADLLYKMSKGGIPIYPDLIKVTYKVKELRNKIRDITDIRDGYTTAESQAENMRFACLLAASVVYDKDGKRYWPTVEDYLAEAGSEVAGVVASKYAAVMVGSKSENPAADWPENKLLIKLGAMDKDCFYLRQGDKKRYSPVRPDPKGEWVEMLVDEEGRFTDEAGNFIDIEGRPVDENGEYLLGEFYGEDGGVVTPKKDEAETEKPKVEKTEEASVEAE